MNIGDITTYSRLLTNTTTTSLTDANLLILINKVYERIVNIIVKETAGGQTPFGDFNWTAFPSFTINMTNSNAIYDLRDWGTTDQEKIGVILGVEVKDQDGNWHPLKRITLRDIHSQEIGQEDYQETDGLPNEYEIRGNQLVLYPAPDNGISVTLSGGLKIIHLNTVDRFTGLTEANPESGGASTKEPGYPDGWHYLIPYGVAIDFSLYAQVPNVNQIRKDYEDGMKELLSFIGIQNQDIRPIMSMRGINHI